MHLRFGHEVDRLTKRSKVPDAPVLLAPQREEGRHDTCGADRAGGEVKEAILEVDPVVACSRGKHRLTIRSFFPEPSPFSRADQVLVAQCYRFS